MKCEQIREQFMDGLSSEAAAHVRSCAACAEAWSAHQKLLALLDEWNPPAISPFFDTKLQARVREIKQETRPAGVLGFLRAPLFGMPLWRPVAAGTLAMALAVGIGLVQKQGDEAKPVVQAAMGTAVGDLQTLDKHQDEISNLELLDDLNAADSGNPSEDEL